MHKQGRQHGAQNIYFLLEIPVFFAFHHHHQNSFCPRNNLNQGLLIFLVHFQQANV